MLVEIDRRFSEELPKKEIKIDRARLGRIWTKSDDIETSDQATESLSELNEKISQAIDSKSVLVVKYKDIAIVLDAAQDSFYQIEAHEAWPVLHGELKKLKVDGLAGTLSAKVHANENMGLLDVNIGPYSFIKFLYSSSHPESPTIYEIKLQQDSPVVLFKPPTETKAA